MSSRIFVGSLVLAGLCLTRAAAADADKQSALQVVLDVRVMVVSDLTSERLDADLAQVKLTDSSIKAAVATTAPPAVKQKQAVTLGQTLLSDEQVRRLIADMQGDRGSNIMQAPRMTLLNGQTGNLDVGETQFFMTDVEVVRKDGQCVVKPKNEPCKVGFRMIAQPTISADRHSVQVAFKIEQNELATPAVPLMPIEVPVGPKATGKNVMTFYLQQPRFTTMTVEGTTVIPNGQTLLLRGITRTSERRVEHGTPVLSAIPYVNRLFRNVGYGRETESLMILVTPRIMAAAAARPASKSMCAPGGQVNLVGELLKAYDAACAAGRTEEAERLARAALILNPECFRGRTASSLSSTGR
jgi:type II secretory pathway component GspD/PulD (secretin)